MGTRSKGPEKKPALSRRRRAFLRGMGSSLGLFVPPTQTRVSVPEDSLRSDAEAMASDWDAVHSDLRLAFLQSSSLEARALREATAQWARRVMELHRAYLESTEDAAYPDRSGKP